VTTKNVQLSLNGEMVDLPPADMWALFALTDHPGWEVLKTLMEGMETGTRRELEAGETPLDSIRYLQGRLSVARDLNDLLQKGVPSWVAAQKKKEQEHADTDHAE
jgi:hypothetical protein